MRYLVTILFLLCFALSGQAQLGMFLRSTDDAPAIPTDFRIVVKTDNSGVSNADQFQFTGGVGDYDVEVWNEAGTTQLQTITGLSGAATITVSAGAGTYQLRVFPAAVNGFNRLNFNNGGDRLKLLEIQQWGRYADGATNQSGAFFGCSNLASIAGDVGYINMIVNGSSMFAFTSSLPSLPAGMELPALTNGFNMFFSSGITSLPAGMELPALTNGGQMFRNSGITSLPAGMALPALTSGFFMFSGCTINTTDYSRLLVDMEAANPNNSVSFNGGLSKYNTAGGTARAALVARSWNIVDGGPE